MTANAVQDGYNVTATSTSKIKLISEENITSTLFLGEQDVEAKKKEDTLANSTTTISGAHSAVTFRAKVSPTMIHNEDNNTDRSGKISFDFIGENIDFSSVKRFVFTETDVHSTQNQKKRKKKLVYKWKPVDVPAPLFWSRGEELDHDQLNVKAVPILDNFNMNLINDTLKSQPAKIWYGKAKGKKNIGSALLMIGQDGDIAGSMDNGVETYRIKSTRNSNGSLLMTYSVTELAKVPEHERFVIEETEDKSPSNYSLDAAETKGCGDASGLAGEWFDSDGPYFNCNWYSRGTRCRSYGHNYANFGFTANQACCVCGGGVEVVDMLVVYSPEARQSQGGTSKICNLIELSNIYTNIAFSLSGIRTRTRIVRMIELSAVKDTNGKSMSDFLTHVRTSATIKKVRDELGADITMFLGQHVSTGAAYLGPRTQAWAFGIANPSLSALSGQFTFAHEVGHLYNAHHDVEETGSNRGYIDNNLCFTTLMSYDEDYSDRCKGINPRGRILHFSNPNRRFNGATTGQDDRNNALAMNQHAPTLASFQTYKYKNYLNVNERLYRNQYLSSQNGRYMFFMQQDGNIVLYSGARVVWSPNIHNRGGTVLVMQGDGNLVVYGNNGAVWASNTYGRGGTRISLQNDRNLVMYNAYGKAVWATNTNI